MAAWHILQADPGVTVGSYTSDAVEALNYAVDKGVKISNNSYGPGSFSQTFQDAITRAADKGHLFVAAAGNGGDDLVGDNNDATPFYRASYENPNVISVAASDSKDKLASWSNHGATSVDLAAPGASILSTMLGNTYAYKSGTSMATPHGAGTAALVKSAFPKLDDATEIKANILTSVDKTPDLIGRVLTDGRLNAAHALGAVAADTTAPKVSGKRPKRASTTRDETPLIKAAVRDNLTKLQKADVRLYAAGKLIRPTKYAYNAETETLTYNSRRLSKGKKAVKVVATDAAGNANTRSWYFTIR